MLLRLPPSLARIFIVIRKTRQIIDTMKQEIGYPKAYKEEEIRFMLMIKLISELEDEREHVKIIDIT